VLIAGHEIQGIGLGTAQFAFRNRTAEDCVATVHAALDAGVTLIDTALAYTRTGIESYAEQVIARALRGLTTGRPLVATKGGHWRRGDSFPVDGRPGTLRAHCEISLRNLEVDRIDLYQLHHVDPHVPLPDSVGALGQLRQEGKIADIGLSNVTIAQLDQALAVAPITAVQNRLSYGDPGDLPMALACAERGVAYLAYSPFNGPAGLVPQAALATASRRGVSAHRVLLAWLRRQSPNIVPLAGASRAASIRDSAARLDLTDSDLEGLGAVPSLPSSLDDRSGMTCCGVRDDGTSAVSGGAGPAEGLRGAV
jgi:aryl-alcohol dehydrogenase-like predicted oxidoreductase